jgi:hypothetical protein
MKALTILRAFGLVAFTASVFMFSSCTKNADGNLTDEEKQMLNKNLESTSIEDNDYAETDEDLTAVDYKEFYDQLAPHGEWVQVQPEEIGLEPKIAATGSSSGIKDAYGSNNTNVGMIYVWKPAPQLGVVSTVGSTPVYAPYSNGQWVNTDAGWYFKGASPVEETVSHYGRWVNTPSAGWLWVPGRVWSPAWVDWRQNDEYVSWAPLPPSVYLVNGTMSAQVIDNNNYVIVERRYFLEPEVYKYNNLYYTDGSRILVSGLTSIPGIILADNLIVNRGPDVNIIQYIYGRNIELVKIKHVGNFKEVRYSNGEYFVYKPGFKRYKSKDHIRFTVNEPKQYKKYNDWKPTNSGDKEFKNENKDSRKDEKDYKKGNNGNGNDNGKKYNDNDNVKKYEDNDKGKKYNDNDKKSNDNEKGNKDGDRNKGGKNNSNENKKGKK